MGEHAPTTMISAVLVFMGRYSTQGSMRVWVCFYYLCVCACGAGVYLRTGECQKWCSDTHQAYLDCLVYWEIGAR